MKALIVATTSLLIAGSAYGQAVTVTITATPDSSNVYGLGLNLISWSAIIGGAGVILGMVFSFIISRIIGRKKLANTGSEPGLRGGPIATQMGMVNNFGLGGGPMASPMSNPMSPMMGAQPQMGMGSGFASPTSLSMTRNQQMPQGAFDYGY